jgi:glycosyltransferase involved in cell wall biosynthesis
VIYEAAGGNFKVINDAEYLQNIRTKFHLPEHFLLCVGTLEPRKNLERFFTAFNLFINKYPRSDLKLVLCGKTWLRHRDFLRSLQTSGIAHKVLMLGYVTGEDLAGIYNCALALAFPSYYEGFGLPAVEAMQCGLPVIASNAFSLPEILQDAALYFDPFDIDEMALAIELISSDPDEREHLRERGLLRAKFFSWEKTAKETEEIYYEALD